ncbi:MAG TPA: ABC transporter substrate-binding protein [Anaerolineales bacterium]
MRCFLAFLIVLLVHAPLSVASEIQPDPENWPAIEEKAKGQTVYWNAWAGEQSINSYIAWAGAQVYERYGVRVEHVKLSDTAEAVAKVIAEKAAGRETGGSVDLIWINGANFVSLKEKGLLYGPWAEELPNYRLVDVSEKPAVTRDFTVATEGYEAPWDLAQLVFYYDSARVKSPPRNIAAMLDYARANPGRVTYPDVQNFLGATFLKQLLMGLVIDRSVLQGPPSNEEFVRVTGPLWSYLDELHPLLWRRGQAYPANSAELRQLLADREIDIAFSFNPSEASLAIARNELPRTVRSYVLDGGTIGNASFLAIPFNATSKEGAMVLANFLLSSEAQARKQDPAVWGGHTILSIAKLNKTDRELFQRLKPGIASMSPAEFGPALPEPHSEWMTRITEMWLQRYASQ